MSLFSCPKCSTSISNRALTCPHCQCNVKDEMLSKQRREEKARLKREQEKRQKEKERQQLKERKQREREKKRQAQERERKAKERKEMESRRKLEMEYLRCPECGTYVERTSEFCHKCGLPFDQNLPQVMQEEERKIHYGAIRICPNCGNKSLYYVDVSPYIIEKMKVLAKKAGFIGVGLGVLILAWTGAIAVPFVSAAIIWKITWKQGNKVKDTSDKKKHVVCRKCGYTAQIVE